MSVRAMLVLGLMSGTSADGIDVALARISGEPPRLDAKLLDHTSLPFPARVRAEILRVAEGDSATAGQLSQLNFRLGEIFAEAALRASRRFRVSPARIALIGSHGQTVFHQGRAACSVRGLSSFSPRQAGARLPESWRHRKCHRHPSGGEAGSSFRL